MIVNSCSPTPNSLPSHVPCLFLFISSGHSSPPPPNFHLFPPSIYLCHIRPLLLSLLWSQNTYLSPKMSMIPSLFPWSSLWNLLSVLSTPLPLSFHHTLILDQSYCSPSCSSARQLNSNMKNNNTYTEKCSTNLGFPSSNLALKLPWKSFFLQLSFIPSATQCLSFP